MVKKIEREKNEGWTATLISIQCVAKKRTNKEKKF